VNQTVTMPSAHLKFWVRMLDAVSAPSAEPAVIEAEVAAEILTPGIMAYDDGVVFGPRAPSRSAQRGRADLG
jgi:hypothetical protein